MAARCGGTASSRSVSPAIPMGIRASPNRNSTGRSPTRCARRRASGSRCTSSPSSASITMPILAWIARLRAFGLEQPVRIGLAGPTSLADALRYAQRCGVRASAQVLARQAGLVRQLFALSAPDALVRAFADARANAPARRDRAALLLVRRPCAHRALGAGGRRAAHHARRRRRFPGRAAAAVTAFIARRRRCAPLPLVGRGWGWGPIVRHRTCPLKLSPSPPPPLKGGGSRSSARLGHSGMNAL